MHYLQQSIIKGKYYKENYLNFVRDGFLICTLRSCTCHHLVIFERLASIFLTHRHLVLHHIKKFGMSSSYDL